MSKAPPNQPIVCPWTSTAPITSFLAVKCTPKVYGQANSNSSQITDNYQHLSTNQSFLNNSQVFQYLIIIHINSLH